MHLCISPLGKNPKTKKIPNFSRLPKNYNSLISPYVSLHFTAADTGGRLGGARGEPSSACTTAAAKKVAPGGHAPRIHRVSLFSQAERHSLWGEFSSTSRALDVVIKDRSFAWHRSAKTTVQGLNFLLDTVFFHWEYFSKKKFWFVLIRIMCYTFVANFRKKPTSWNVNSVHFVTETWNLQSVNMHPVINWIFSV